MTRSFEPGGPETVSNTPDKAYIVYILRCRGNRLYTGITTDLERRVSEHEGITRGAKFTRAFAPEGIAAAWEAGSRSQALKLEARIKKLCRREKDALIAKTLIEPVDCKACRRIR